MIRLIAIDLDDTLLGHDLSISPANMEAIQAARQLGVHVVIATARGWHTAKDFYQACGLDGYTVCGSGTKIFNSDGTCIKTWSIPLARAKELLTYATEQNVMVYTAVAYKNLLNLVYPGSEYKIRPVVDEVVPGLHEVLDVAPTQLFLKGEREVNTMLQAVSADCKDYRYQVLLYRDGIPEMMIVHPEASKATGLAWVCEKLGIKSEEVLALGDSANDIPMLRWAGVGVAMGWAPQDVQEAADHVTAPDDEDGCATTIRKYVLG
ncbi:HAD family hydrolase [Brevibacillus dissolubilis]|uniref:HAD family hydrolase n=1 Tax=Brevibacillus dissolubilis TaxID=1844116 RepID=UPI00159BC502|nr:HAD family hydrolase [Brevibacillus dissolubilis]